MSGTPIRPRPGRAGRAAAGCAAVTLLAAGPGWAQVLAAVVVCLALLANAVLPQESADRLRWWQSRWQAQQLRRHDVFLWANGSTRGAAADSRGQLSRPDRADR